MSDEPCKACGGKGYTRPFIGTGNPEQRACDRCIERLFEPAPEQIPGQLMMDDEEPVAEF